MWVVDSGSNVPPTELDVGQLESDEFQPAAFITHGQVSLINYATEPREIVLFDGSNSIRTKIDDTVSIELGMILRLGGVKRQNPDDTSE